MKPKVLITVLVLGLGLLFSSCASRMLIIREDTGKIEEIKTGWGSTLAVVKEDGSLEVYNNRYPPLGKFEFTRDSTGVVSYEGTFPGYGYYGYGYPGYDYYDLTVPGAYQKPPSRPDYYQKLPSYPGYYRRY